MTPDIILQRTGIDVRAVEQGDDAWHKLRLGVITASEVHNVIAKPRSGKKWPDMKMSYFHTLLAEVCTGVAPEVNAKALAWGKQYENDARALFEFTSGVNVTESPIIYRDESMRTACSPDGLCSDGNGLELKCPFTSRDFMKFRLGGFEAIKSAYMAQVQYSMWVTQKDAWYFANFRETDLKNIRSGTPATIRLMSDSGKTFEGKVDSIGYGVLPDDGGLVLGGLPKVSRSINWVRVAQRFPVKIMVDKPDPEMFRIGASAVANLEPQ